MVTKRAPKIPPWLKAYAGSVGLSPYEAVAYAIQSTHTFNEAAEMMGTDRQNFYRFRVKHEVVVSR